MPFTTACGSAAAGSGVEVKGYSAGQWTLAASRRGLLGVRAEALGAVNALPGMSVFSLYDLQPVDAGETVAKAKITPLAMPEALTLANQQLPDRRGSTLRAANSFDVAVCASAALLQGRLAQGLPPIMAQAFEGLTSDAQRALQFVRSAPGVNVALVGMKSSAHVDDVLQALRRPPASIEAFSTLFTPNKRG